MSTSGETEEEEGEQPSSPESLSCDADANGDAAQEGAEGGRRRGAHPPPTVSLIYKKGDDLRQDQLCVQARPRPAALPQTRLPARVRACKP